MGRDDQDRHRPAAVLGHDVALGDPAFANNRVKIHNIRAGASRALN
jgi:hypothetical protein